MDEEAIVDTGSTHTDTSESVASETVVDSTVVVDDSTPAALPADDTIDNGVVVSDEPTVTVPESYDFGESVAEDMTAAMAPIFKEAGLTQEQVSKLTEAYGGVSEAREAIEAEAFTKQVADWTNELKNDPDFGGDNFDQNAGEVAAFFDATVPEAIKDDFKQMLETTGLGSHPNVVRYFHALSRLMPVGEDSPSSSFQSAGSKKPIEDILYPNG